jgi:hypothetical protein
VTGEPAQIVLFVPLTIVVLWSVCARSPGLRAIRFCAARPVNAA